MKATKLARLSTRRYESVIRSLNGKIGSKTFDQKDFIGEITGYYEMVVGPFTNRMNHKVMKSERERE